MTTQALLVIALVVLGATAYICYVITDGKIGERLRDALLTRFRAPTQARYDEAMTEYRERVAAAYELGNPIPTDVPAPPEEPLAAYLIQCRWCTALSVSVLSVIIARLAMTATYPLLDWYGYPLHPLDVLVLPAWALANSYAIGFLASKEGD